jgi:endonuclease III
VTKRHGQHPCVPGTPRCRERFLTDLCDYYQAAVCPRAADR